jgi:hypothetical protein
MQRRPAPKPRQERYGGVVPNVQFLVPLCFQGFETLLVI